MNWKFNGLMLLAIGGALWLALWLSGQPPRTVTAREVAEKHGSERFPGVPDRYDPVKDGPVWLGAAKFVPPPGTQISGDTPALAEFALLVNNDGVGFFTGGKVPPGGWLIDAEISTYAEPIDSKPLFQSPGAGLVIAPQLNPPRDAPLVLEWIAPVTIHAQVPDVRVRYADGAALMFNCYVPWDVFERARARSHGDGLEAADAGARCSTFFMIRHGVRVLLSFPTRRLAMAHRALPEAITLIDQALQKPRWSEHYPGIPDSYDPITDGPVYLGPYKFVVPMGIRGSIDGLVFQMLVVGDEVSFRERVPGGEAQPAGSWLTYNVIGYGDPGNSKDLSLGIVIDPTPSPWRYEWVPPSTVNVTLPGVTRRNGQPIIFSCDVPMDIFASAYATGDLDALRASFSGPTCRAEIPMRQGIGVLFKFPTSRINEAELPVLKAILLIDQSIQEK